MANSAADGRPISRAATAPQIVVVLVVAGLFGGCAGRNLCGAVGPDGREGSWTVYREPLRYDEGHEDGTAAPDGPMHRIPGLRSALEERPPHAVVFDDMPNEPSCERSRGAIAASIRRSTSYGGAREESIHDCGVAGLTVVLVFGPDGQVERARIEDEEGSGCFPRNETEACVLNVIRRWTFPSPGPARCFVRWKLRKHASDEFESNVEYGMIEEVPDLRHALAERSRRAEEQRQARALADEAERRRQAEHQAQMAPLWAAQEEAERKRSLGVLLSSYSLIGRRLNPFIVGQYWPQRNSCMALYFVPDAAARNQAELCDEMLPVSEGLSKAERTAVFEAYCGGGLAVGHHRQCNIRVDVPERPCVEALKHMCRWHESNESTRAFVELATRECRAGLHEACTLLNEFSREHNVPLPAGATADELMQRIVSSADGDPALVAVVHPKLGLHLFMHHGEGGQLGPGRVSPRLRLLDGGSTGERHLCGSELRSDGPKAVRRPFELSMGTGEPTCDGLDCRMHGPSATWGWHFREFDGRLYLWAVSEQDPVSPFNVFGPGGLGTGINNALGRPGGVESVRGTPPPRQQGTESDDDHERRFDEFRRRAPGKKCR